VDTSADSVTAAAGHLGPIVSEAGEVCALAAFAEAASAAEVSAEVISGASMAGSGDKGQLGD